jgi:PKHD-type hydroxylase
MGAVVLPRVLDRRTIGSLLELATNRMILVGGPERKKHRLQVPNDYAEADQVASIVLDAVSQNALFQAATYPETYSPPRICHYGPGMGYRDHLDNPHMGSDRVRTDVSVTISLTDGASYEGGDLVIDSDRTESRWKGNAGDCIVYSGHTIHRVDPVVRGARIVIIFWIQSMVREDAKREILFDLARGFIDGDRADPARAETMHRCHRRLLKMWSEP